MFTEAKLFLTSEWGEFPKLASIGLEADAWVFKFYNHAGDTRPDTYVREDFKKLVLVGNDTPVGNFFLPDDMTSNELGDYLATLCGQQARLVDVPNREMRGDDLSPDPDQQPAAQPVE